MTTRGLTGVLAGTATLMFATIGMTGGSGALAAPPSPCSGATTPVDGSQPADRNGTHYLTDAAAVTGSDVWAVGVGGLAEHGTAVHWDGTHWTPAGPSLPRTDSTVQGVTALSPNDVWAVGDCRNHGMVWHWGGAAWQTVPAAARGTERVTAIDAVSAVDVWTVGIGDSRSGAGPVAAHWDGTRWGHPELPGSGIDEFELLAVSGQQPDDVWAVGNGSEDSAALHWDGRQWTDHSAGLRHRWFLEDLAVVAPGQVWAVGRAYPVPGEYDATTLVVRWTGARWVRMNTVDPELDGQLYGIDVVAPDDVWVVGASSGEGDKVLAHTLIEHWDGHAWSVVPSPSPGQQHNLLFAVAAAAPDDVWAVGAKSRDPVAWYEGSQLLLHWDGTSWTWVRKTG